jgi:PAS domain-containing protein
MTSERSPEISALPAWAHFKDPVYATTFEPIAIVYNKRLVPAEDVPKTHADFVNLLTTKADKYQKKITTYDAEKSGVGFMLANQDLRLNPASWDLVKAMGARGVVLQSSTGTMLERISSGENLFGYQPEDLFGTNALDLIHPDDRDLYREWHDRAAAGARSPGRTACAGGEGHYAASGGRRRAGGVVLCLSRPRRRSLAAARARRRWSRRHRRAGRIAAVNNHAVAGVQRTC